MITQIVFTKMVASGNDFVILDNKLNAKRYPLNALAQKLCDRKFGVGADGMLVLEKSAKADIRMRIFNADGSEAEMCGNGARCAALYISRQSIVHSPQQKISIETKAGIIESKFKDDNIKIKLTDPRDLILDMPLKINGRNLKVNFINTGVPHTVILVHGLDDIDVFNLGRQIRYHKEFEPKGTNVNFIEIIDNNSIRIRTYERGVEDETLACGTGSTAAALITSLKLQVSSPIIIKVHTKSGEILKVYFNREDNSFKDVWLEGMARIVYKGEYYV